MWDNAQRHGRPAEYRWRTLLNAAVWLMPTIRVPCSNAAKMRNTLKFAGVPQTNETISAATGPKFTIFMCQSMVDIQSAAAEIRRGKKEDRLAATLWWFTAAPKPLKIQVFLGSSSPQGSHSPYILGDRTRPGHVTCVLVWSKSDWRRLRKTLHKQTDKRTDRHYENNGHLAVNQLLK